MTGIYCTNPEDRHFESELYRHLDADSRAQQQYDDAYRATLDAPNLCWDAVTNSSHHDTWDTQIDMLHRELDQCSDLARRNVLYGAIGRVMCALIDQHRETLAND